MSAVRCHAPDCGNPIPEGARSVGIRLTVDWGEKDLRDAHTKGVVFCSFGCLSDWANERAADHDQRVLARPS